MGFKVFIYFIIGFIVGVLIFPYTGFAAIPDRQLELQLDQIVPVRIESSIDKKTMEMIVPTNIPQTNDSRVVENQILDHNIKNLVSGKYTKNSEIVESAQKIQSALKPSLTLGGGEGGIQHKIDTEFEATQGLAKIHYDGFVKSNVSYSMSNGDVDISLEEKLSQTARVVVRHTSQDDMSRILFNIDW